MKLFRVSIQVETVAVILAEDESEAYRVARSEIGEIINDSDADTDVSVGDEIKSSGDLPHGWDETCSPYAQHQAGSLGMYLSLMQEAQS